MGTKVAIKNCFQFLPLATPKEFKRAMALLILPYDSGTVDELACAKIFIGWRKKWLGEYHLTKNNLIFVTEKC